jgi:hypothetical protein
MIRMPGKSYSGPLPALTDSQAALADELQREVTVLAGEIGPRCLTFPEALEKSAQHIEDELTKAGFVVQRQEFEVHGQTCANVIAEIPGKTRSSEIVVVGAHYDSCYETPAANDNGSGVAATLALARRFSLSGSSLAHRPGQPDRTLRFVFFVNEEPPYFQTDDMGSLVYARACKAKNEHIVAMLSLETIGYYRDEPGTQRYPIAPIGWVYPGTGNFISFVGNFSSRDMVRKAIATFRSSGGPPPPPRSAPPPRTDRACRRVARRRRRRARPGRCSTRRSGRRR